MKKILSISLTALLLAFSLSVQAKDINIDDPWLRAAPPNAPALAVFMTLQNHSDKSIALVAVKGADELGKIELHRTIAEDGMMKMIPQINIPIAPQSSTVLKPGSWHIMLIKPSKVPKKGDTVQLTLIFDNGSEQQISLPVRKGTKMMKHGHKMHNHKMMSK